MPRPRTRFARFSLLAILAASAFPALAQPVGPADEAGASARPIFRPTTITRPGAYKLGRSFGANDNAAAIRILADDVTLDLGGQVLTGPGDGTGTGIEIDGAANVRVANGKIQDFGIGISAQNAHNVVIEGLQIDGRDSGGSPPDVEVGVLLVDTRGALVRDNVVTDTFLGIFVRGAGSSGNRISGNLLTGGEQGELGICYNPAPGASSGGPTGDLVYDNVVSRFRRGLALSTDSAGNVVRENTFAYLDVALEEATAGSNLIEENSEIQISPSRSDQSLTRTRGVGFAATPRG